MGHAYHRQQMSREQPTIIAEICQPYFDAFPSHKPNFFNDFPSTSVSIHHLLPWLRASAPVSASNSKLVFQVQPGLRILLCKRASAILWAFPLQRNRLPLLPGIRCSFTHGAHNKVASHPPFIIYHGNFTSTGRSPPGPWDFRTQHRAVREGILRRALGHGGSDGERVHPDGDGGALWSSIGIQPFKT